MQGIELLKEESAFFEKARPFSVGMSAYAAILWVGALLGVTENNGLVGGLLNLLASVVGLYISWILIQGVAEMEEIRTVNLNQKSLLTAWKALVAVEIIMNLLQFMLNLVQIYLLVKMLIFMETLETT